MKAVSDSSTLRRTDVKEAIGEDPHIAALAKKLDDAHLADERDGSQATGAKKLEAKEALLASISTHQANPIVAGFPETWVADTAALHFYKKPISSKKLEDIFCYFK